MPYNEVAEHKAHLAIKEQAFGNAVTVLMSAYGNDIFRFCFSILNNQDDAQDSLQNVFIQAHRGLSEFQGNSNFRTWLYAIARNRCLDLIKKNRRLNKRVEFVNVVPEHVLFSSNDEDKDDHFVNEILRRCLSKLSSSVKTAILLRFQSECSYKEAASIVQEEAGTLQARVTRALPQLRRCVEENGVTL